ncbi:MAG: hypothetical protein RL062_537, partial [Bacteroidota bacterium]
MIRCHSETIAFAIDINYFAFIEITGQWQGDGITSCVNKNK